MKTRALAIAVVAFAVVGISGWASPPAQAQSARPTIMLVGQDPWTPLGGTLHIRVDTSGDVSGMRLVLTVHDRLLSRSGFDATLSTANPSYPPTRALLRYSLDDIPIDALGTRTIDLPVSDALSVRPSGNGVYPIEVQLRDTNDTTVSGFVTHALVVDPNSIGKPLEVVWVWPLVADPAFAPDGSPDASVAAQLRPDGRLGRQALAIGQDTDVPLTLAPSPETLDAWATLASDDPQLGTAVDALGSAPQHHQVVAGPFVPLDLPSLASGELGGVVPNELQRGTETLEAFFGTHLDPSTAMPGPLDGSALDMLRTAARTQLIVDGSALEPFATRLTPSRPTLLGRNAGDSNGAAQLLVTDPALERYLTGDDAPALRAAHLLAALAVIAGEQPSLARGVAFANPASWDPAPQFVTAVLAGLRGNPLLRPVTADTLFADTPRATVNDEANGDPVVRTLAPVEVRKPPVRQSDYYEALQARVGIAQLFGPTDARVTRADRALLSVLAASWENRVGRQRARAMLDGIGQSGRDFLSRIQVPQKSTVTITASSAQIPLTFRNDADKPVDIHVALQSDKLLFPDGTDRDVTLDPGKNRTVRIAVETRSSGTYPLLMTVTTSGGLPISTSEVTVRSSFVSGVGVFLTVGAIVFLALWWGWDIRRRRRRRAAA